MTWLLHMTTATEWERARRTGRYAAGSLPEQGFLHLSTAEQVSLPANALFAGRRDIVLLCVDRTRLDAELRWESGDPPDPTGMEFPHLYGSLPVPAVRAVVAYRPDDDGVFHAPTGLPPTPD